MGFPRKFFWCVIFLLPALAGGEEGGRVFFRDDFGVRQLEVAGTVFSVMIRTVRDFICPLSGGKMMSSGGPSLNGLGYGWTFPGPSAGDADRPGRAGRGA